MKLKDIKEKKETIAMTNEDKRKPKKNKKKKRQTDNDQGHVSPAEKHEKNEGIVINSDKIQEKCKMYADLPESDSDGAKLCTGSDSQDIKKKKKKKKDCIVQGEISGEENKECDEIMRETMESQTSTKKPSDFSQNESSTKTRVHDSELDQDEVSKKSKRKKKKRKVEDGERNFCIEDVKVKSTDKIEAEGGSGFKKLKKESDSEEVEMDNSDIAKVKRKSKSKDGRKKSKRKREEVSKQVDIRVTDDDSQGNEEEDEGEKTAKKKKKKKSKDKTKNKLVEDKEKSTSEEEHEVSGRNDDAVESQWQSAEFGDTVQKEKFLRLMGAYKPSNKQRAESSYSVMAMNRRQQTVLSNSLEKQFDQALQTRKERGVGLGYQQL